jgi:hypothetical protein
MKQAEHGGLREELHFDEDVRGPGVEWLATDCRGHVALFTAVAPSEVSPVVLDALDAHRRALAEILDSPPTTRSVFDPAVGNERGSRWRAVVERGLFVFAAYRPGGPYWIAEAPRHPLRVVDLPAVAGELVGRLPPVTLPFKHVASVMPDTLRPDPDGDPPGPRRS